MTGAIYLRVSTDKQTVENQRADLERIAKARGCEVVEVYEEIESAAKSRPVFDRLMGDSAQGRHGAVFVWALDRLHRSMFGAVRDVLELDQLGVRVVSYCEPWLDTAGPVRQLLVAVFGWVAEQERNRLRERTRAALAVRKARGVKLGRAAGVTLAGRQIDPEKIRELKKNGLSVRRIAQAVGVPRSTVQDALAGVR